MADEEQIIPKAQIIKPNSYYAMLDKNYINSNKFILANVKVDDAELVSKISNRGAKYINVREDIIPSILKIKNIFNIHRIAFTCNEVDTNKDSELSSHMAKLGLEIRLNENAGLTTDSTYEIDDYFVGPDYSKRIGDYYRLKVYGYVRNLYNANVTKYKLINYPIDIYDIRNTFGYASPKIIKIFKPLIDITQIFEDEGFIQPPPEKDFFLKSNNLKSNWNIFYNTKKIKIGDTYRNLLEKIYKINGKLDSNEEKLRWDGEKFV